MRITVCLVILFCLYGDSFQYVVDSKACRGKNEGDEVDTDNPCTICHCAMQDGKLSPVCAVMDCGPCAGKINYDDDSCCGQCDMTVCMVDGKEYKNGQEIEDKDPCSHCTCNAPGDIPPEVQCAMTACYCPGRTEPDGSCCGKCIADQCEVDGRMYSDGEKIKPFDECAPCHCMVVDGVAQVVCSEIKCAKCPGEWTDDGSCCGSCEIPETLPYQRTTTLGGPMEPTPACDAGRCPRLKCKEKDQYQDGGMCCPECKCKYNKKMYNPGPVGDECDGCVCSNGKVTCTPPPCPKNTLQCVNPIRGDDCCYYCPDGITCKAGKKDVIKAGELKTIKNSVCTCFGDPWWPMAFCASKKVPGSLFKGFEEEIADYPKY